MCSCHQPPNFTDFDFHNLGVPNAGFEKPEKFALNASICGGLPKDVDPGRGEVGFLRSSCSDLGKFKTPTLRNIALSKPYMHNGVFEGCSAAADHLAKLAKGEVEPVVGRLDPKVAKGAFQLGAGGDGGDEVEAVEEFLKPSLAP